MSGIAVCGEPTGQLTWSPGSLLVSPGESQDLLITYTPRASRLPECLRLFTNDPQYPEVLLQLDAAPVMPP